LLRLSRRFALFFFIVCNFANAGRVEITPSGLSVDSKAVPFLFGAEVQYFRARGGSGRNVPAATVKALWEKLLDRVTEAKMNSVIFYIPWDFHEPVEGTFDFDGTLDQDRDGNPDYPSRNLKLFLTMVQKRGLKHVMVRPGPYINAEWGPVGFGAIPKWFLDNYPQALAKTLSPNKPLTANFAHPEYRARIVKWFTALEPVLRPYVGAGKMVDFLQIDNETNYFWDSVYERDWSPLGIERFRAHVASLYTEAKLQEVYGPGAKLATLLPPHGREDKTYSQQWHYDWFQFHDAEIHDYYQYIKGTWEKLGITDQEVLFTTCDSFNAPVNGLLPRLDYRAKLSHSTMNIYPKTFGSSAESILNFPMKAAHDARLFLAAQKQFGAGEWLMTSETMAGWFPPVQVTLSARQHTYGSLLGNGVSAIVLYYFHEGYNWTGTEGYDSELSFDAPLDKDMNPRPAFQLAKSLGETLAAGLGDTLLATKNPKSQILLAHDGAAQYPFVAGEDTMERVSTGEAAAFGLLREAGETPDLGYLEAMPAKDLASYQVVVVTTPGYLSARAAAALKQYESAGGKVLKIETAFAAPWNLGEVYPKVKDGASKLAEIRQKLSAAGVKLTYSATTEDGQPGVHVWYREGKTRGLLFAENFSSRDRKVELSLTGKLKLLWGSKKATAGTRSLTVGADSVDIWEVTPN